jgi:hypothetical protein
MKHATTQQDRARREKEQTLRLAFWTLAWVLSQALATFGPEFIWPTRNALTATAIGLNLLLGAGMVLATRNHLLSLDELQRKINLDAMAVTLGVGVVAGLAWSTMDATNLIPFDAEIAHVVVIMGLTYLSAVLLGQLKYR